MEPMFEMSGVATPDIAARNDAEQVAHGTIDWFDAGNDNARNHKWNERE